MERTAPFQRVSRLPTTTFLNHTQSDGVYPRVCNTKVTRVAGVCSTLPRKQCCLRQGMITVYCLASGRSDTNHQPTRPHHDHKGTETRSFLLLSPSHTPSASVIRRPETPRYINAKSTACQQKVFADFLYCLLSHSLILYETYNCLNENSNRVTHRRLLSTDEVSLGEPPPIGIYPGFILHRHSLRDTKSHYIIWASLVSFDGLPKTLRRDRKISMKLAWKARSTNSVNMFVIRWKLE